MSDFDAEFEKLAEKIAAEACLDESLMNKVDALKALQPYYALRQKNRKPPPASGSMDDLRNAIRLAGGTDYDPDAA